MTVAWVFPGQGSQIVGMGRDLYQQIPSAREVFDQANEVLDLNISRLCFEGPENDLTATENAQPALVTVCAALLRALDTLAPGGYASRPQAVAGHSLGEYSALVAAGAMDIATAIRLVRRRGELMAESSEGTMAAVIGLDEQVLGEICTRVSDQASAPVVIANFNAPGQLVLSGATAAVEQACAMAKEQGARKAIPLKVSAAFHSPLMATASEGMAEAVGQAAICDIESPSLIGNVSAAPLRSCDEIRKELVAQVVSPVHWIASVQYMLTQGVSTFIEIGPGSVLTGMIKRIARGVRLVNLCSADDVKAFAESS